MIIMADSSPPTVKPLLAPVPVRPLRHLAQDAGVNRKRLFDAARAGQLPVVQMGKRLYSTAEVVREFLTPKPLPVPNT